LAKVQDLVFDMKYDLWGKGTYEDNVSTVEEEILLLNGIFEAVGMRLH